MLKRGAICVSVLLLGFATTARPLLAATVSITPSKDNTLYEDVAGSLSNALGNHLFLGKTAPPAGETLRRALIQFDVAGNVPAGAVIHSARLRIEVDRIPPGQPASDATIHKLTADWGEGTSMAAAPEGPGTAATAGDATWIHTFSPGSNWGTVGGDFVALASSTENLGGTGSYTFGSTSQTVADVQDWLDNPGSNFGWIVRGDEVNSRSAKRFASSASAVVSERPTLIIDYYVLDGLAGTVNSGTGPVTDVLKINGSAGGANRVVCVPVNDPITVSLDAAPVPGSGKYAMWVWPTIPCNPTALDVGPETLGTFGNPIPLTPGGPQPFRCVKSAALPNALCGSVRELTGPACAPWSIPANGGISVPTCFFLQALIKDQNASNSVAFSVTNGVVLKVE